MQCRPCSDASMNARLRQSYCRRRFQQQCDRKQLTTQHRMPRKCIRLRFLCRKATANTAAKSISAPLIIWYTEAVTDSRPMFMSTVAMRSKTVGMASMKMSLVLLPLVTAVSFVLSSCIGKNDASACNSCLHGHVPPDGWPDACAHCMMHRLPIAACCHLRLMCRDCWCASCRGLHCDIIDIYTFACASCNESIASHPCMIGASCVLP